MNANIYEETCNICQTPGRCLGCCYANKYTAPKGKKMERERRLMDAENVGAENRGEK